MKKNKRPLIVLLIIFLLISIPIIIKGINRYGNNWIDISKNPAICHYEEREYYEISWSEYMGIKGEEFEYMDKYIVNGKPNIIIYYLPTIMSFRVGELRNSEGKPIALVITGHDVEQRYFKLSE
ncbi:MAG: hypothetical protein K6C99_10435 [Lachnospiraceae bacterium]|nr:hypothetical protein [Lachnospiraceae bacterium]